MQTLCTDIMHTSEILNNTVAGQVFLLLLVYLQTSLDRHCLACNGGLEHGNKRYRNSGKQSYNLRLGERTR